MNGNREKGSIKDRLISMLYRMRYKKKKLKEENYTIEGKEKQVNYLNNLNDFREEENINILDKKDKTALNNVNYTANFSVSPKKSFFDSIPVQEKQEYHEHAYIDKGNEAISNNNHIDKKENSNKQIFQRDSVAIKGIPSAPKMPEMVDIKLASIESNTNELSCQVDLKKEVKKAKEEIVILKEVDNFIKESKENLEEISVSVNEIKKDLENQDKTSEEIERKYEELKIKISKLKNQYDTIKDKYDLSEFSIIGTIKIMDSIDNYKTLASLNEIEMMVKVCKSEIDKIDNITVISEEGKVVEENIENRKEKETGIKVKFNKNQEKIDGIKSIEETVAYELREQERIIDEMYKQASHYEKEITKKIEYIGHRNILSSLLRIAGGVLTVPFTGLNIFGIALGTTMINKGLKEMNKKLETREKIVVNYKYEDISSQISNMKDKVEYTNLILMDSLNEIQKLKENFNQVFKDYEYILPEFSDTLKCINLLEKRLQEGQNRLLKMDKKLDEEKEINQQKLEKVR